MQFAVFTVSTPDLTPEEVVATIAELGYRGVEWRVIDQEPSSDGSPGFWQGNRATLPLSTLLEDAPRVRALAESAGLQTVNLGAYVQCSDLDGVERAMRGAALLGAPSTRIRVPRYDGTQSFRALRDRSHAQFREVESLARLHGVKAVIETHQDTILPSASGVAWFLQDFDPVFCGAIWDPGNMVKEGHEQYRLGLEALGPYLAHVQLKSARWEQVDGKWRTTWAPLRTGIVDVPAVFAALQTVGYDGWISMEDFSTEQPLVERLRDNLAYVRELVVRS